MLDWSDIYLRQATRLIKELLSSKYPDKKFTFQYRQPSSYYNSSDKLIITISKDVNVDEVVSIINENTRGINVFKSKSISVINNLTNEPYIHIPDSEEWFDADVLEFIEIKQE